MPVYASTNAQSAIAAYNSAQNAQAASTAASSGNGLFASMLQSEMGGPTTLSSLGYTATPAGVEESPRWTSVAEQEAAAAAAEEAAAEAEQKSLLSTLLPVLLMGMMGGGLGGSGSALGGSGASPELMMAMMLALSSERGMESFALSDLSRTFAAGRSVNSIDGVRAYAQSMGSASQVGTSAPTAPSAAESAQTASVQAASTAAAAAAQETSAEEKARFNAAAREISSHEGNRSPELYRQVLDGLDVENNPRYAPRNGSTYCNIFMWDATKAMGAEIPHYTNSVTGDKTSKDDPDVMHMNANRISNWLNTHGERYGWYEVSAEQAQALANQGHPAVTIWKNKSGGHGHCQVVSPSKDGSYDPVRGVAIAQAGRRLKNYDYITSVYSPTGTSLPEVQYFAHK